MSEVNQSEGSTEQSREKQTSGSQGTPPAAGSQATPPAIPPAAGSKATKQEQISNDGSHAPTNDLTTEQLFEIIRKQNEKIEAFGKMLNARTEVGVAIDAPLEIPKENVKFKGKAYKWTMAAFILADHGRITAEQAATDKKVIEAILAIEGQGILKELV